MFCWAVDGMDAPGARAPTGHPNSTQSTKSGVAPSPSWQRAGISGSQGFPSGMWNFLAVQVAVTATEPAPEKGPGAVSRSICPTVTHHRAAKKTKISACLLGQLCTLQGRWYPRALCVCGGVSCTALRSSGLGVSPAQDTNSTREGPLLPPAVVRPFRKGRVCTLCFCSPKWAMGATGAVSAWPGRSRAWGREAALRGS